MKALLATQSEYRVVAEASNARAGLEAVQRHGCDLVLIDYHLPDEDGPWLVAKLRHMYPDLATLVVSQFTEPERVRKAVDSGCNGYVVKSAEERDLLTALRVVAAGGIYIHPTVAPIFLRLDDTLVLSDRERETIQLLTDGLSNQQMADRLNVSLGTVKRDLSQLYDRLAVSDRTQLVTEAIARGLAESHGSP
jgi:DNA-binding NarL/FixJ family response regulator